MSKLSIPQIPILIEPKHDIVICSTAVGEEQWKLLNIMKPTVEYYANLHNMDHYLLELTEALDPSRPHSWGKIILMNSLLPLYKTVIWIDSDAVIVNPHNDIRHDFDKKYAMQLVTHFNMEPIFPNCGFWVVHQDPRSFEILEAVWNQTNAIHGSWWEQHGLLQVIGYQEPFLTIGHYKGPTKYSNWVGTLDLKWNSRPDVHYTNDDGIRRTDVADDPIVLHDKRMHKMKEHYELFLRNIKK